MSEESEVRKLNYRLERTVRAWGGITVKEFIKAMRKRRIREGDLYKSFRVKLEKNSEGRPVKVVMEFLFYGRFVDMGVGRGVKLENVKGNREVWRAMSKKDRKGKSNRYPKKWYSPVMYREFQRLSEILLKVYAINVSNIIELKNIDIKGGRVDRYIVNI